MSPHCAWWCLARLAGSLSLAEFATAGGHDVRKIPPICGQSGYHVFLKNIEIEGASLSPPFSPKSQGPYEAVVANAALAGTRIIPDLEMEKYSPRFLPQLQLDGKTVEYEPIHRVHIPVNLSATHESYDRSFTLTVADPWGGYFQVDEELI